MFATLLVVYVSRALHGGAREYGWLMSAQAIGGIIGGLLIGATGKRLISRWAIGIAAMMFGLIDLVIFNVPRFYPSVLLVAALFVLVGIPGMGVNIGLQSLIQQSAPGAYLGRVFGALYAVLALMLFIGIGIASTLADKVGVITLLNIQGSGYIIAGSMLIILLAPAGSAILARVPDGD